MYNLATVRVEDKSIIAEAFASLYEHLDYYIALGVSAFTAHGLRRHACIELSDANPTTTTRGTKEVDTTLRCFEQEGSSTLYVDRVLGGNVVEEAWFAHPDAGDTVMKADLPAVLVPDDVAEDVRVVDT
jgi:hypothetical protein